MEVAGADQRLDGVGRDALGVGPPAKRRKLAGERAEPGGGSSEVPERQVKGAKKPFVAQQIHALTYRVGQVQATAGSFG